MTCVQPFGRAGRQVDRQAGRREVSHNNYDSNGRNDNTYNKNNNNNNNNVNNQPTAEWLRGSTAEPAALALCKRAGERASEQASTQRKVGFTA